MNKLKVIEFQGLAPSVFCGLYFADQGCQVILIARAESAPISMPIHQNIMNRNKKCVSLSLKNKQQLEILKQLIKTADIVIDPFRPGVLEKIGLGPKDLNKINQKCILLRVSGYGQQGELSLRPGHDLNYLSVAGILPSLNKKGQYYFPHNYFADFVSASLGITGVLAALHKRQVTGKGSEVDCSLAHGAIYFNQNIIKHQEQNQVKTVPYEKFVKIDGVEYLYTHKKQNIELSDKQILKFLSGKDYYISDDKNLQISIVKNISTQNLQKFINAFNPSSKLSNKIPRKNEHIQIILNQYKSKL